MSNPDDSRNPPPDTSASSRRDPRPRERPEDDDDEDEAHLPQKSRWKTIVGALVAIVVVVIAVVLTLIVWDIKQQHPRTDDAFLRVNVVGVAPRVKGQLVEVYVSDNQMVKVGDPLFQIDTADYELTLTQKRASLASLDEQIENDRRDELSYQFQIKSDIADVESSELKLKQANDSLHRNEPLLGKAYAAVDDVEKLRTSRDAASSSLAQSQQKLAEARTKRSSLAQHLAQRPGTEAEVRQAELDLAHCRVVAEVPGRVINVNVSKGAYVNAGSSLFSMTDARHWYVIAEFREGELRFAPPGSAVDLYLLADPIRLYQGHIRSVGGAVSPSNSEYDLPGQLPSVPRELDWVHIAQRFPVRIEVDNPDQDFFRMGASAVVTVHPAAGTPQRSWWR